MELEKDLYEILNILNENGKGYIVGGYVRDKLLGISPKDCDFCTDIEYEKLLEIFKDYSPKEIGKSFGIVQIKYKEKFYEIAKLRKDIEFTKDRNKVEIEFVEDIYEDLKRRDFTINAIAFDGKKLIYVNEKSKEDIKNKVIRFVGNGEKRIEEDPLRVLRGIRIATEKNLKIDSETEKEMLNKNLTLSLLSMERVQEELFKIFKSENILNGWEKLIELKTLEYIFPEIQKYFSLNKNNYKLKNLNGNIKLFLIYIFLKVNGKDLEKLKIEKNLIKSIKNSIIIYDKVKELEKIENIRTLLSVYGKESFCDAMEIKKIFEKNNIGERTLRIINKIVQEKNPINIKDLSIKGRDILELGVKPGPLVKEILDNLFKIVLKEPILNNKNFLLEKAKEML